MKNLLVRPDIFTYHDYRKFLNDWLVYMKGVKQGFSMRQLCKSAGLSPAYLSLVLSEKRVLTIRTAEKVSSSISLAAPEKNYFKLLVRLAESPSQTDRLQAYQKIKRFGNYQKSNSKEVEAFRFLSHWYYVAIRELAVHPDFDGSIEWLQKQLIRHVPSHDIQKALDFLLENGFLAKSKDGKFSQPNRDIDCLNGIFQLSLNQFHKQILEMASESIDDIPKERRHLSGYTFLVSEESYPELIDILEKTKEQIRELETRDQKKNSSKTVYHVELAAFPMTGRKK